MNSGKITHALKTQIIFIAIVLIHYSVIRVLNMICSGMSFQDLMVRQGVLEHGPKTPVVMGFECAGEVEALGENTSGFNVSFKKKEDRISCFKEH